MNQRVEEFLPLTNLAYQILVCLGRGDLHGYAIIQRIEDVTGGETHLRSGTLYTAIQGLVDAGLVEPSPQADRRPGVDSRRRHYRLTKLGRRVAIAESERLGRLLREASDRDLAGAALEEPIR